MSETQYPVQLTIPTEPAEALTKLISLTVKDTLQKGGELPNSGNSLSDDLAGLYTAATMAFVADEEIFLFRGELGEVISGLLQVTVFSALRAWHQGSEEAFNLYLDKIGGKQHASDSSDMAGDTHNRGQSEETDDEGADPGRNENPEPQQA